jgi:uncharacterized Tic20 family protein
LYQRQAFFCRKMKGKKTMTETPLPPGDPTPPVAPVEPSGGALDEGNRTSAALCHYLNVIWLVPLILYLTKKDQSPLIKQEGRESLNFSLTALIAHVICAVTACFVVPAFISLALFITQIVLGIIGGNKVRAGESYTYPWKIEFIKP